MNDALRIGHGIDVHKFAESYLEDKPLKLAGLIISDNYSLLAHSDGDVVLHAICDAILGACAAGDIGQYFPDADEQLANADSSELLEQVLQIAGKNQMRIINLDVTVLAQVPLLAPHRQEMMASLCTLRSLDSDRVNIKATTTERLGYIGREEGIACHAVILMESNA